MVVPLPFVEFAVVLVVDGVLGVGGVQGATVAVITSPSLRSDGS